MEFIIKAIFWLVVIIYGIKLIWVIHGRIFILNPVFRKYKECLDHLVIEENDLQKRVTSLGMIFKRNYSNLEVQLSMIHFRLSHELDIMKLLDSENKQLYEEIITKYESLKTDYRSCAQTYNEMEELNVDVQRLDKKYRLFGDYFMLYNS